MNKQQLEWLREFSPSHYIKDIITCFNKQFNTNLNYDQIRYALKKHKIKTLVHTEFSFEYPKEEINWIKENRECYNDLKNMVKDFNKLFNRNISYKSFINLCNRHNAVSYNLHKYSKEEDKWILDNYQNYIQDGVFRTKRFINDFEKEFSFKIDCKNIGRLFERLGIKKPKSNVGLERCPIGFEKKTTQGTFIKVSDNVPGDEDRWENGSIKQTFNYRKKSHVLYEQYHNIIIDDEEQLVIHLDNNSENFNKDNLYLIDRKAFAIYHNTHYQNECLETKLNALKISEIYALINKIEKRGK